MRAQPTSRGLFQITKATASDFSHDNCTLRAAALAYYTAFALPPLLILLIKLAGLIWTQQTVQHSLETQFAGLVGSGGATQVSQMVSGGQKAGHGVLTTVLGFVGLLLGATGAFLSLQDALNAVWEVGPDPKQGGIKLFITKRLLSLGMLMGLAFLLVVSLAVSAAAGALGGALGSAGIVMQVINTIISLAILSVLFAAMYKFLPDASIGWGSVWVGAIATAVLFEIGKIVIGLYLGHSNPGSAFGAASAFAVILVWIYYAGMLFLFGAEFTQHWAHARGHGVRPKVGAVRIEHGERIVRGNNAPRAAQRTSAQQAHGSNGGAAHMASDGRNDRQRSTNMAQGDGHGRVRPDLHRDLRSASIGDLFKELSTDSSRLIQDEVQLAKIELRESVSTLSGAAGKVGIAAVLAIPGLLALTAALVIGIGLLIDSYWVSALIVGAAILVVAGILAQRAVAAFKRGLTPRETIRTVREDVDWAKHETTRVKQQLSA